MKNGNKEYICPNCGKKHTLVLVSTASAQFEIHRARGVKPLPLGMGR